MIGNNKTVHFYTWVMMRMDIYIYMYILYIIMMIIIITVFGCPLSLVFANLSMDFNPATLALIISCRFPSLFLG